MTRRPKSELEATFARYWTLLASDLPEPEREYRFHPTRRWRFDFAWPAEKVAVEIEGGIWTRGRHVRGSGFEKDCEKYNMAVAEGWRVFRLTRGMLEREPGRWLGVVIEALGGEVLPFTDNLYFVRGELMGEAPEM